MAIEGNDWYYVGGAAVGGALVAVIGDRLFSGTSEPIYTGVGRTYQGKKGDEMHAAVWAVPGAGYISRFETPVDAKAGIAEEAFPDMERDVFKWPFLAAIWADDVMYVLGYEPTDDWAHLINEATKTQKGRLAVAQKK